MRMVGISVQEHCEPAFHLICRVNRSARKGAPPTASVVRGEAISVLTDLRSRASGGGGNLAGRYARVEAAVASAMDDRFGGLDLEGGWRPVAPEFGGEADLFEVASRELADPSDEATESLAVLYTLIGLGCVGAKQGKPDELREAMRDISARLRHLMDSDRQTRIVPEAYEHVDTSDLVQPPARSVVGLLVALVTMAVVVVGANAFFYNDASGRLRDALSSITSGAAVGGGDVGEVGP